MSRVSSEDAMERAAAAWLIACDDILAGLSHALNNRLAALGSIARVIEYGDPSSSSLFSALLQEVEDLERTTHLLRAIPWTDDEVEPIHLEDCLRGVINLQRLRRRTRDLEYRLATAPGTPPVVAQPILLNRALLLILGEVAETAVEGGASGVSVRSEVSERLVVLRFDCDVAAPPPVDGPGLTAARTLLETCGATIPDAGDQRSPASLEVHLPAPATHPPESL